MATDFAVVKINSKQHLIGKNTRLKVDSISEDAPIEVMMVGIGDNITLGEPLLSGFGVKFQVLFDGKDDKIIVRRYKSKSRYRKNKGHRQPITTLKVVDFGKDIKNEFVWEDKKAEKTAVETPKTEKLEKAPKAEKSVKPAKSAPKAKEVSTK